MLPRHMDVSADHNKREGTRLRVLKGAKIVALNQWTLLDCGVRDISETGAKLICADPLSVADEFRLLLPSDNSIRNARVVWRRSDSVGVVFTSPKTRAPARKF